jgi:uroporphyrinogen decarboxylase
MTKRFEQALRCERPDRVPFLPAIYEHKGWFVGVTPSTICRDAQLLTTALLAEYERIQPDALTVGVDVYNVEAEAVGCTVTYYEGEDTSVPAIASTGAAFQGSEGVVALKMPDPKKDGRMPLNLEVARTVMKIIGNEVVVRGAVSGPFSMAAHLAGPEHFFLLTMTQPPLAQELIRFSCEVIKRYGKAFIDLGCGIVMFDSHASSDLLPPEIYRDMVLPATRRLVEYFQGLGVRDVPLVIGGNTTRMLTEYLETGANNILCDARADAKEFLTACSAARRAFRRNMDSSDFATLKSEDVHRRAMKCLEESEGYAGFILGTTILPYGTPLEPLAAIREAIKEYKPHNG